MTERSHFPRTREERTDSTPPMKAAFFKHVLSAIAIQNQLPPAEDVNSRIQRAPDTVEESVRVRALLTQNQ